MVQIKEIMTKKVITITAPNTRAKAILTLIKHKITGAPVVKKDTAQLIGLITRQDFFQHPEEEQVSILMKKDIPVVAPEDDVNLACKIFLSKNIHHLPVVKNGKLNGIVTPADVLKVIEKSKSDKTVRECMKTPCIPLYKETPITVANAIIELCNVYAFPVVDQNVRLIGIVTDRDIFNVNVVDERMKTSILGATEDADGWSWDGLKNIMKLVYTTKQISLPVVPVEKIMIRKVVTVYGSTPVSEAAKKMRTYDYGQLPVVDAKNRLIGMIYDNDLLNVLLPAESETPKLV